MIIDIMIDYKDIIVKFNTFLNDKFLIKFLI